MISFVLFLMFVFVAVDAGLEINSKILLRKKNNAR